MVNSPLIRPCFLGGGGIGGVPLGSHDGWVVGSCCLVEDFVGHKVKCCWLEHLVKKLAGH